MAIAMVVLTDPVYRYTTDVDMPANYNSVSAKDTVGMTTCFWSQSDGDYPLVDEPGFTIYYMNSYADVNAQGSGTDIDILEAQLIRSVGLTG